jgi:hypothetical protein
MPVFHLRIFSREANFSFVIGLSTGTIWNELDKDKRKIRFARKNSQVENRLNGLIPRALFLGEMRNISPVSFELRALK